MLCRHCNYNLEGLPNTICPECGRQFNRIAALPEQRGIIISPRTTKLLLIALVLGVLVLAIYAIRWGMRSIFF